VFTAAWALSLAIALQAGPGQSPAGDPWPDGRPFTHLAGNLRDDAGALIAPDEAMLVAAGAAVTWASHEADDDVASRVAAAGPSSITDPLRLLGDGWVQGGAALSTYVAGRLTGHAPTTHVGSDLIRAQLLNGLLTQGLKRAVGRTRPNGGHHAFPSGHTSAAFTSAAVLERHYGWKVGAPAYAVAGLVGWSRVRDNVHWLSDVLMGATIGTAVGRAVTAGHRERAWQVVPVRTDGGFAVYVVRRP